MSISRKWLVRYTSKSSLQHEFSLEFKFDATLPPDRNKTLHWTLIFRLSPPIKREKNCPVGYTDGRIVYRSWQRSVLFHQKRVAFKRKVSMRGTEKSFTVRGDDFQTILEYLDVRRYWWLDCCAMMNFAANRDPQWWVINEGLKKDDG